MPFPFGQFLEEFTTAVHQEIYDPEPAIVANRNDPHHLLPQRYPPDQYRLRARPAPDPGPLRRSPGVWKGQTTFRFKSICATLPVSRPQYIYIQIALRLSVHLVQAGFVRRTERRDVQHFLVYLARHCIEKDGRLSFKKGFGGPNCFRALVYLAEERARRYPFVL